MMNFVTQLWEAAERLKRKGEGANTMTSEARVAVQLPRRECVASFLLCLLAHPRSFSSTVYLFQLPTALKAFSKCIFRNGNQRTV